ncbi:hypothetical protein H5404_24820 (plasmid) [Vibrio parahaemolyticus]|nr:hypothetical protein [Vibrio parahaemolyticus]QNE58975.1 hypothetical protein H5404_24820 [Vibrio parahaemolyticus]TNY96292.1 hypothetical protein CGK56_24600 [Vibrio parahaemolyticus]
MQFADPDDIQHLRRLLKSYYGNKKISAEEIEISECEFMYDLLREFWTQVPTPSLLLSYAKGIKAMPLSVYTKLVDVRLCEAD